MNRVGSIEDWQRLVSAFESCSLAKEAWTHRAHLIVGLWYVLHYSPAEALNLLRHKIRQFNEATGGINSDSSGYHETLTRLYVAGIHDFVSKHSHEGHSQEGVALLNALLDSAISEKAWPLTYYSRENLMSPEARRRWVEPDVNPLANDCFQS